MPPMNGSFDATQFAPNQLAQAHPAGIYDATIANTTIQQVKDKQAGYLAVEFATQAGRITMRYNLWNESPKAVEIAHGQLSALCHATGIFKLDWQNEGAALRGARCKIEVGPQAADDKYSEVKRVLDPAGNEPGKAPANVPQQGSTGAPQAQAWGVGGSAPSESPMANQPPQSTAPGGWGAPQGQPPQQYQQPQNNAGAAPNQAWQPGPSMAPGNGAPPAPWGNQG